MRRNPYPQVVVQRVSDMGASPVSSGQSVSKLGQICARRPVAGAIPPAPPGMHPAGPPTDRHDSWGAVRDRPGPPAPPRRHIRARSPPPERPRRSWRARRPGRWPAARRRSRPRSRPPARARPVLHSRQTPGDPIATAAPSRSRAAALGSSAGAGLAFDDGFIDHRQPAQGLPESDRLAHIPPPAVGHSSSAPHAGAGYIVPEV
jgi:hypothetical protein